MRYVEKYAVRIGGGVNHRFGLYDMVLIKDNHKAVANWYVHQKIRKYAKELKFVVDEYLNLDVLLAFEDFLTSLRSIL